MLAIHIDAKTRVGFVSRLTAARPKDKEHEKQKHSEYSNGRDRPSRDARWTAMMSDDNFAFDNWFGVDRTAAVWTCDSRI
jgi:hypothetical protein